MLSSPRRVDPGRVRRLPARRRRALSTPGPEPDPLLQHQSRRGAEGPRALLSPVPDDGPGDASGLDPAGRSRRAPGCVAPLQGPPPVRIPGLSYVQPGWLDELREDLRCFSGDWLDAWYQRWSVDGDQAVAPTGHPCWSRPEPLQSNASKGVCATPIRYLEAPMRRLDRDVSAALNGPWAGPLLSTHRATWRAG
jgi:hypothetical protein